MRQPQLIGDRHRQLELLHQPLAQPRGLAHREADLQHVEGGGVRAARGRPAPAGQEGGRLGRVADNRAPLAALRWLALRDGRRARAGRDVGVELLDQRRGGVRVHVPDHVHRRVARRVVGPEEALAVVAGDALDVLHPADHRPAVRVGQEDQRLELLLHQAEDRVLGPQPALLLHHLPLLLERVLGQPERAHPIGLEVDHGLERVGREVLVVGGHVVRRVGVGVAAARLEHAVELLRAVPARAVEHHVLEEVADPRDPEPLVPRAHLEEGVVADGGGAPFGHDPDP